MKRPRMKDIAEAAGVSQPAVSLVLAGRTDVRIPDATRKRILETAARLNYRVDGTARNLAAGKTDAVAFVYDSTAGFMFDDPFCRGIFAGVIAATESENLSLIFSMYDAEKRRIPAVEQRLVDGVLYLAGKSSEALAYLKGSGLPFVSLNPDVALNEGSLSVTLDDVRAGETAAKEVKKLGHREVVFVNVAWRETVPPPYAARVAGFRGVLPEARSILLPLDGLIGDSYRAGEAAVAVLGNASAAVCVNDQVAWGLMDALRARGRAVPGAISVVGFEGLSRHFGPSEPTLASVRFDRGELGRLGMSLLHRKMAGKSVHSAVLKPAWQAGTSLGKRNALS